MRTFWTYFSIFMVLTIMTQAFLYIYAEQYVFDWVKSIGYLALITVIALIVSFMFRKPKNPYNEKMPTKN